MPKNPAAKSRNTVTTDESFDKTFSKSFTNKKAPQNSTDDDDNDDSDRNEIVARNNEIVTNKKASQNNTDGVKKEKIKTLDDKIDKLKKQLEVLEAKKIILINKK